MSLKNGKSRKHVRHALVVHLSHHCKAAVVAHPAVFDVANVPVDERPSVHDDRSTSCQT